MEIFSNIVNIFSNVVDILTSVSGLLGALKNIVTVLLVILLLIAGGIFFVPSFVAIGRNIKKKVLIIVANVCALALFLVVFILPVIAWVILLVTALSDAKKPRGDEETLRKF